MPNTGLQGPFTLNQTEINKAVTRIGPGVYALGYVNNAIFIVQYVGRSDDNLRDRLHDWVGQYRSFKASYLGSSCAAFERECRIYHAFGGSETLHNEAHPDCPDGLICYCPICGHPH